MIRKGIVGALLSRARTTRIGLRVLAFNLLVVFLPVAGILYLDVYESQLLESQERGMIQQAQILSAALGREAVLDPRDAQALVARLGRTPDARMRVHDANGQLVVDTARVFADAGEARTGSSEYGRPATSIRERALYRVGVWIVRARRTIVHAFRSLIGPRAPEVGAPSADASSIAPELRMALSGRYGAATRPTPGQRSLTLHSAVPVQHAGTVIGAVQVSQSTFRVLQSLYLVRLRIFQVVVASLLVAAVLSVLVSATIVRPIVRLRRAALAFTDRRLTDPGFHRVDRRDEIGDLARALDDLTRRLDAHIRLLESFAADVSHEFKNPLASIRTVAEMIASADSDAERARFLAMLTRDVDRLERLVSGVRELARIDGELAHEPPSNVDVGALLLDIVQGMRLADRGSAQIVLRTDPRPLIAPGAPDRLAQVFENILQNARSFAPAGSTIEIVAGASEGDCRVTISDRGPGIPPAHLDRVFDRFFSYRPDDGRREHTGLGLAIARAIVEGYRGTITAANRAGGGSTFEVRLPF
jgi:two-component system, OmpR family, sensor histidine kinase ChvG